MPTDESLWRNDSLGRKEEGEFLSNYLVKYYENNRSSPFVLNINAEWGFGKTYFLTNLSKELETKKYPVVYFTRSPAPAVEPLSVSKITKASLLSIIPQSQHNL